MKGTKTIAIGVLFLSAACPWPAFSAAKDGPKAAEAGKATGDGTARKLDPLLEMKAKKMISDAEELIQAKQEDRAVKMLEQVPRMYPGTMERFRASLILGKMHADKRRFEEALRTFKTVLASEKEDDRVAAIYNIGICQYNMNDFDQAFLSLRRVINEFPWSVYANESYYYIGLCHFKLRRWYKAVDALRMVGTSVPSNQEAATRAEIGQRLYVKIQDKDLSVFVKSGNTFKLDAVAASGDKEEVVMETLGRQGEDYIGSVPTQLAAKPVPGDGTLQGKSGDVVKVTYVDINSESKERNIQRVAEIHLVSTGRLAIMDGACVEALRHAVANQPTHVQLVDADLDATDAPDKVEVPLVVRFKKEKKDGEDGRKAGVDLEEEIEWQDRSSAKLTLVETEAHSGVFRSVFLPVVPGVTGGDAQKVQGLPAVDARVNDTIALTYTDSRHIDGDEPCDLRAQAVVVLGSIPDVVSPEYSVTDAALKVRKHLVESRIFLQWARIFKDVGLQKKAGEKSDEGLERLDEVMRIYARSGFERALVEEAFQTRWELLIVKDLLDEAVNVCLQLIRIFPDSGLVDQAFLAIGKSKLEREKYREAVSVFYQILRIPTAGARPEAQYLIGEAFEKQAIEQARKAPKSQSGEAVKPNLAGAMQEYKKCADDYPDSKFAGEALKKIVNYYLVTEDNARAVETVQVLLQDYEDAPWLDEMLLRGGAAAFKMGNLTLARDWFQRIVESYSAGKSVEKAQKFLATINQRLGDSAPVSGDGAAGK